MIGLTGSSGLASLSASTAQNDSAGIHSSKVFRSFEAETHIGSYNNNSFPREVFIRNRRHGRELIPQELKEAGLHVFWNFGGLAMSYRLVICFYNIGTSERVYQRHDSSSLPHYVGHVHSSKQIRIEI